MTRFWTRGASPATIVGELAAAHLAEVVRYVVVGVGGMIVSVVAFAIASRLGVAHTPAAAIAFACALTHNFIAHRIFTFRATDGHLPTQWGRFIVVNLSVFAWSLIVLHLCVGIGVEPVLAQAIAVVSAAVPNYLGQKLWSFRR